MRVIPKNSKVSTKLYKSFTFADVVLAFCLFLIGCLIVFSNISFKWYLLLIYAAFAVVLFFPNDDVRMYGEMVHIIRYMARPKVFTREHKKNRVERLIPYTGLFEDGTVNYGDSYYSRVVSVGSIEFRLLDEFSQNAKISAFARIMNSLSLNQSMQIVKVDRPIVFDKVSGNLFAKITDAEKEAPRDENKTDILKSRLNQIDTVNNLEKLYRPYYYLVFYDNNMENLDATVGAAVSILSGEGLRCEPLGIRDTALFLKYCNQRDFDERKIDEMSPEDYIDYLRPEEISFGTQGYKIDGVKAFSYTVSDFPLTVANAWGAGLFNIDNTKVVLNIVPVNKEKAVKRIDKAVGEIRSLQNTKASKVISQETHLETMDITLQNLQNGNESLFDCTLTVTAYNNDDVSEQTLRQQVRQAITTDGFKVSRLRCRQMDAFISTNISRFNALKSFERGINSESIAAVFPFVFTSVIDDDGICLGAGNYPVILDVFKWAQNMEQYTNANIVVFGKPGSGKSYFVKTALSLLYSEKSVIYALDPENEYKKLSERLGGTFIDVGNATEGKLNPFHIYDILTDSGTSAPSDTVYFTHLRFLESFFQITMPGISSDTLEIINNLVPECYAARGITPDKPCANLAPEKYPVFDDLYNLISSRIDAEKDVAQKQHLRRAESYLSKFASGGRDSGIWNGPSSLTSDSRFNVFNFQSLFAARNTVVANGQMLLTLRFLEQQVINAREKNRNGERDLHPIIALDEGYMFVDQKYPVMLDFIFQWFKRIRKYKGSMILITQNIKDLTGNSEILSKTSTIISNSQYHFVFSLAPGDVADLAELYRNSGGINETEMHEIGTASKGHVFMISSASERTSFDVVAPYEIEALFSDAPLSAPETEADIDTDPNL